MNSLLLSLKNSPKYLSYPFIFAGVFLFITNALNLFSIDAFETVYAFSKNNIELIFAICAVFFVCSFNMNSKKAITCSVCYLISDLVFYSLSNEHYSLLFSVIIAFLLSSVADKLEVIYLYLILLFIGVSLGVALGVSYEYLFSALRRFCGFVGNKAILFGVFNNFYSIAFSDNFEELIFTKDYSLSAVIDDNIVAGIKNIFIANPDNAPFEVAQYLSGKYLVNIFVVLGITVALYSRLSGMELLSFLLLSALSIVFGDIKLFSLFILIFNPVIYLSFLGMTFVSYLVCSLLDLRIGYADNGSVFELFRYGNNWIYFLLSGLVIAVMSYFLTQIVISKFDIQKRKILPREVRRIINSLGGEKNIVKIKEDSIIVKNPNLINVLNLDCDINENEVVLHYGELDLIKQYY